jgi:mannose-6-phosphate isomerase-like protein (cupin superfamily)
VLQGRPDLTAYEKPNAGFTIRVVPPGQPAALYHAESVQEDFLILMGECVLIIENQERHLRAWDFVHCPPMTDFLRRNPGAATTMVRAGVKGKDTAIDRELAGLAATNALLPGTLTPRLSTLVVRLGCDIPGSQGHELGCDIFLPQSREPGETLPLELPDALPRQADDAADFSEGHRLSLEAEAEGDDLALSTRQRIEQPCDPVQLEPGSANAERRA